MIQPQQPLFEIDAEYIVSVEPKEMQDVFP